MRRRNLGSRPKTSLTRSFGAASPEAGEANTWSRGTRHPNSALDKVPLLKSSPGGRGEEAANSYAKVSFGRGKNASSDEPDLFLT
jgi:hypothetical protein